MRVNKYNFLICDKNFPLFFKKKTSVINVESTFNKPNLTVKTVGWAISAIIGC